MKYTGWAGLKKARVWREKASALHRVALQKKEEAEAKGEVSTFDCDYMCKHYLEPLFEEAGLMYGVDWKKEKGKINGKNHYRLKVRVKMCYGIVELLVDPATGNKESGFVNNKDLIGK